MLTEGTALSQNEADRLEKNLEVDPFNLKIRTTLIGYYFNKIMTSGVTGTNVSEHTKHVLWLIEKCPDETILEFPQAHINPIFDKEGYTKAGGLWLKQINEHNDNVKVLFNASRYFTLYDRKLAKKLLERLREIDPNEARWPEELANLYAGDMRFAYGKLRKTLASKATELFEEAIAKTVDEFFKFYYLTSLCEVVFETGDYEKAKTYTQLLLEKALQFKDNWNYGNAVHYGNILLGRLALQSGDVEQSKKYLIKAGKTPGSPNLNSFGPSWILAKELLNLGEKEVVLEYLKYCSYFWEQDYGLLQYWVSEIRAGRNPDFERDLSNPPNVNYKRSQH